MNERWMYNKLEIIGFFVLIVQNKFTVTIGLFSLDMLFSQYRLNDISHWWIELEGQMISRSNFCMLRYAMILSIHIEAFLAIFLCANNFHRELTGKRLLQTFPFLRRVTNKANRFLITCLKLAIKIDGVSRICCFFNRTQWKDVTRSLQQLQWKRNWYNYRYLL